ncbi:hypothetical protein JCGZ_15367 [Jatropha curcas]|uniref:Uncharacterized protein n=1 Tax=Jatropha curcas TaxID=180498 RepID=A0A067KGZ6_JATCU|nr:uncharacterized protein LOC105640158 [Jatropha curcas]KDP31540.1 hypothetical protein JCGZ_15367 [Jatropha curcas]
MDDQQLFQPLLPTATISCCSSATLYNNDEEDHIKVLSSNSSVILRLFTIFSVGVVSIWANYEASKGFDITIINDAKDSPAGKRFALFYMSNDKAIRIIQNTSSFVETFLYPNINNYNKKYVSHVTLRLASTNLTDLVVVETNADHEFAIHLSPSVMGNHKNLDYAVTSSILQGMAQIWLWNGESRAPRWILDGLVEYIKKTAGFSPMAVGWELPEYCNFCSGYKDPKAVASFLDYCQRHREGFIQRLNQALKVGWDNDRTVEDASGMQIQNLCNYAAKSSKGFSV